MYALNQNKLCFPKEFWLASKSTYIKHRDHDSKSHVDAQLLILSEREVGIPEVLGFLSDLQSLRR